VAESTILVGKKSRTLVAPVFIAVVLAAALVRGLVGARTNTGRVVMVLTMGTLLVLCVVYSVWLVRQPAQRLEVRPDRIVLWQGPDRGIQLGTAPPIQVRRTFIRAGTHLSTTWLLTDASGAAFRFAGQTVTPLAGARARIDLTSFHPTTVLEAVQRAGWPAEQRI
jgi:hypothetical protein